MMRSKSSSSISVVKPVARTPALLNAKSTDPYVAGARGYEGLDIADLRDVRRHKGCRTARVADQLDGLLAFLATAVEIAHNDGRAFARVDERRGSANAVRRARNQSCLPFQHADSLLLS